MPAPPISQIPAFDDEGDVTVVVETPKGSRNKVNYDEALDRFRLRFVLPEGTSFPHAFGFVPSTKAEDGDPLDVLLLMDEPVLTGCLVAARLIGVIEAEQTKHGKVLRNDRLLAVATQDHTHRHVRSLDDLRPGLVEEVEAFFAHYQGLRGNRFTPLARGGPDRAMELLRKGLGAGA